MLEPLVSNTMDLKTIAISRDNYQILKNLGKAGDSFNDVITHLVKKAGTIGISMNNEKQLLQSDQRPGNHNQTVAHPERHNVPRGVFNE
jgi:predicted CopG family antitoxin